MAEHTMGLLLALARNFPDSVRYQDQAHWSVSRNCGTSRSTSPKLNGQRAAHCRLRFDRPRTAPSARSAFDMRVWGVTRSGKGDSTHAEKIRPRLATE